MGCCENFPWNPLDAWKIPGWMVDCVSCVIVDFFKAVIDSIVGFFTDVFNAVAGGIIFLIDSIKEGMIYIFDFFYGAMEWILGQFGITAPIIMAVAVVVFLIFVVFAIRTFIWIGERTYELL